MMRPSRSRHEVPSVRTVALVLSAVVVLIVAAAGAGVLSTLLALEDAMRSAVGDRARLEQAEDLERMLLTYHRLSALYATTAEPELEVTCEEIELEMRALVGEPPSQATAGEQAAHDRTAEAVRAYLTERDHAIASGLPIDALISHLRPYIDRAIHRVSREREVNRAHLHEGRGTIARALRRAQWAAAAALALLALGCIGGLRALRHYVLRPLRELHGALEHVRAGACDVRVAEVGTREMRDLAATFNEMSRTLRSRRDRQLELLAGVAHDLRNPLSGLKACVQALREDSDDPEQVALARLVDEQFDRLSHMVSDLLDSTLLEAGRLQLSIAPVDLCDSARSVVALYGEASPSHHLELMVEEPPVVVEGDVVRIEQVLGNLVSNAIKFSQPGGLVRATVASTATEAIVEVSDDGVGIAPEEMADLFTPFRRTPSAIPGTGIGLSVARRIVEAHGGTLEASSTKDETTFRIRLPLAALAESTRKAP